MTDEGAGISADLVARFGIIDYIIFGLMLALSAGIGIFYGCFGSKMKDTKEFLMAGKSMTTFPVAMSLIASFMSAITLLGTPSEVYQNGFSYWLIGFSYFLVMPSAAYLFLPVFWKLQVTSAYEYLEHRFNSHVRKLGSFVFILQMSIYMAIVVYAPALALTQVTGMNVYVSVSLICVVCIFYTTLGGMKAVLWTDALQVVIMYTSMVFIIIWGAVDQGGFWAVWEAGTRGNRTTVIDWDPTPQTRHTFWTCIIGGYFTWITIYGCNQAQVQRYLCVKKQYMAKRALFINMIGLFILMIVCAFGGLVIYAKYETCDPISAGRVSKGDQLLPLYVLETLGTFKGLPGLFVAGIFSGALSTVSSGMNSLAAITLEDFLKACMPNMSEKAATRASKVLSLFYGVLTFALVFVAEQLGSILSAALGIFGMIGGPLSGVFTLGMFLPWANSCGALVGTIVSLVVTLWIGVGYQVAVFRKELVSHPLPYRTDGCEDLYNITLISDASTQLPYITQTEAATGIPPEEQGFLLQIYQISYLWYSFIGCWIVIIVGMLVSFATGVQDVRTLNPDTMSPLVHWIACCLPGGNNIGIDYVPDDHLVKVDSIVTSNHPVGASNMGYVSSDMPRVKNGHIEHKMEYESSRL